VLVGVPVVLVLVEVDVEVLVEVDVLVLVEVDVEVLVEVDVLVLVEVEVIVLQFSSTFISALLRFLIIIQSDSPVAEAKNSTMLSM